jgi:hypothetical protein
MHGSRQKGAQAQAQPELPFQLRIRFYIGLSQIYKTLVQLKAKAKSTVGFTEVRSTIVYVNNGAGGARPLPRPKKEGGLGTRGINLPAPILFGWVFFYLSLIFL